MSLGPTEVPPSDLTVLEVRYEAQARVHLSVPLGSSGARAPVLVGIHGYGQSPTDWLAWLRSAAPPTTAIAVPEGPETWYRRPSQGANAGSGHAWIGAADRGASDARNDRYLDAVWRVLRADPRLDTTRTVMAGFSQGVGVLLHHALHAPGTLQGLVGLAGGLATAYRPLLPTLRDLPLLWVSGRQDASYPPAYAAALLEEFRRAGLALQSLELEAGHDLLEPALSATRAFLAERLAD